jgi:hypothetical protein
LTNVSQSFTSVCAARVALSMSASDRNLRGRGSDARSSLSMHTTMHSAACTATARHARHAQVLLKVPTGTKPLRSLNHVQSELSHVQEVLAALRKLS